MIRSKLERVDLSIGRLAERQKVTKIVTQQVSKVTELHVVLHKGSRTSEKSVMLNIAAAREVFLRKCNFEHWFRPKLAKSGSWINPPDGSSLFKHCTTNEDSGNKARAIDFQELI